MITDRRCNGNKRDFLASAEHVERWRALQFGSNRTALMEISTQTAWEQHPQQTFAVARSIYLRLPSRAKVWFRGNEFVDADLHVLSKGFDR